MSRDSVVLITGASTGIGLALVKRLRKKNYRLALTARTASLHRFLLEDIIQDQNTFIYPLDVTDHDQRCNAIDAVLEKWGQIDVLVNNAGISYRAVVEHMSDEEEIQQLATNFLGPMALTRLVLPGMRKRGGGKIINISSVSGMMAMPTMSSYSASKFALEGATESLWYEMKPWSIKVSIIEPGFIHSGSFENVYYSSQSREATLKHTPYWDYYESMAPFVKKMMNLSLSTADDVAKTVEKTIEAKNPKLRIPATWDAHFFYWLRRLIPRKLYHWILYRGLPGASRWAKNEVEKEVKEEMKVG